MLTASQHHQVGNPLLRFNSHVIIQSRQEKNDRKENSVLIAKPGWTDMIAALRLCPRLRDDGMEVIYTGLRQTLT
jgi:methylmalonyl-CoA mutase cobalamin-binding subunit